MSVHLESTCDEPQQTREPSRPIVVGLPSAQFHDAPRLHATTPRVLALQRTAGNAAVGTLLVERSPRSLCLGGNLARILAEVALAALLAWIAAELLMIADGGALVLA